MPGPPLSCQKISELTLLIREETRFKVNEPIRTDALLDIIDALNRQNFIIAEALVEISDRYGALSAPTLKQLAQILRRDSAPLTKENLR